MTVVVWCLAPVRHATPLTLHAPQVAGTYTDGTGGQDDSVCMACGTGKSTKGLNARTAAADCVDCVAGTYAAAAGLGDCSVCVSYHHR